MRADVTDACVRRDYSGGCLRGQTPQRGQTGLNGNVPRRRSVPVVTILCADGRAHHRDNVTWCGHCVIHLMAAINDLPDQAKLAFGRDLEKFIKRQHRALRDTNK